MKWTKFLSVLLSVLLIMAVSCFAAPTARTEPGGSEPNADNQETIKIASWNIENFEKSKATDERRMRAIAAVLKDYDIIAVQEISNVKEMSDPGCPRNENACPDHYLIWAEFWITKDTD